MPIFTSKNLNFWQKISWQNLIQKREKYLHSCKFGISLRNSRSCSLGAIFILRKDIGVVGWFRKWKFSLTLCDENVLTYVGWWVAQKSFKTRLRNMNTPLNTKRQRKSIWISNISGVWCKRGYQGVESDGWRSGRSQKFGSIGRHVWIGNSQLVCSTLWPCH